MGRVLRPGRLLRFTIGQGGIFFKEGQPVGADLQYVGPAGHRRVIADTFSKIMFQAAVRRGNAVELSALLAQREAMTT
jgi:hypothetical protein